jgi:hypothetical protein
MMQRANAAVDSALLRLMGRKHLGFNGPFVVYGLASRISALVFWAAGFFTIYRYLSAQSPAAGFAVVALLGTQLMSKMVQGAVALRIQYVRSGAA